jgi:glycine hydroxymethyltransferase
VSTSSNFDGSLASVDPEVAYTIGRELARQRDPLELIASENFAPVAVLEAHGSVLTKQVRRGITQVAATTAAASTSMKWRCSPSIG